MKKRQFCPFRKPIEAGDLHEDLLHNFPPKVVSYILNLEFKLIADEEVISRHKERKCSCPITTT